MNIVVAGAMRKHQLALKIGGLIYGRRIRVALGIILRAAHVTLGVNRVVEAPVGYGRDGDAGLENVGRVEHGIERHVAAVTPAPDADARAIHVGERLQIFHAGELVFQLDFAE